MKKLPIFIALDIDQEKSALDFAEKLSPYVMGFKVGPRLYFRSSSSLIPKLSQLGQVFLDFKFYDIPSTMLASVRACFEMSADYVTVHASAGRTALSSIARLEKDYKGQVLAVTVLTSQKEVQITPSDSKLQNEKSQSTLNVVLERAETVYNSGLKGLVASPYEVQALRKKYPDFFIAVPGIRVKKDSSIKNFKTSQNRKGENLQLVENEDQSRTASPSYAFQQGASVLVMGRPILQAVNPVQTLQSLSLTF